MSKGLELPRITSDALLNELLSLEPFFDKDLNRNIRNITEKG